jgi:hypothetical protein
VVRREAAGSGAEQRGTLKESRALSCFWQAVLGLRWFRDRTRPDALARDHGISRATAYRYLNEVIDVLADQAPDLQQALARATDGGIPQVILDGKIIAADRRREKRPRGPLQSAGVRRCGRSRGRGRSGSARHRGRAALSSVG